MNDHQILKRLPLLLTPRHNISPWQSGSGSTAQFICFTSAHECPFLTTQVLCAGVPLVICKRRSLRNGSSWRGVAAEPICYVFKIARRPVARPPSSQDRCFVWLLCQGRYWHQWASGRHGKRTFSFASFKKTNPKKHKCSQGTLGRQDPRVIWHRYDTSPSRRLTDVFHYLWVWAERMAEPQSRHQWQRGERQPWVSIPSWQSI